MNTDKTPAESAAFTNAEGGKAGRRWGQHRSLSHVELIQRVRNRSMSG